MPSREDRKIIIQIVFFGVIFVSFISFAWASTDDLENLSGERTQQYSYDTKVERPVVRFEASGLRNPFKDIRDTGEKKNDKEKEKPVVEIPLPKLTLQGIIWGGEFPQAIINNNVVKVGDMVEGVKVLNIDKNGVTLVFEGKEHFIAGSLGGMNSTQGPLTED
ncbi:MAG: hypothetical protein HY761_08175 [Candidatus Omnitrophica bacterium]|nr:hypothetical protein [Candidatus Omnitrophota bacterium]